jgi:hypothetical protein
VSWDCENKRAPDFTVEFSTENLTILGQVFQDIKKTNYIELTEAGALAVVPITQRTREDWLVMKRMISPVVLPLSK